MANPGREDRRLRRLSSLCLALPEAERTNCGTNADFRIRGKVFAYFLRNYQGDGITAACFKTGFGEHLDRVQQDPRRFYLPRCIGLRGWYGVRLDLAQTDWEEIAVMAADSYDLMAPPELRKPVDPLRFIPPRSRRPTGSQPGGRASNRPESRPGSRLEQSAGAVARPRPLSMPRGRAPGPRPS